MRGKIYTYKWKPYQGRIPRITGPENREGIGSPQTEGEQQGDKTEQHPKERGLGCCPV